MRFGKRARAQISATVAYIFLTMGAAVILTPLAWMLSTSLKDPALVFRHPPQWIPNPVVWSNYQRGMTIYPFVTFFANTAKITTLSALGAVISSSVVAYSFARLRWSGRDVIFLLVLASMMLPSQVTLIPHFVIYRVLGWYDTHNPLIVPSWFAGSFFVFLLRQYMMTIPRELDDAALIDGCSRFTIFPRIILPLAKAPIASVAIFSMQWSWNDFFGPLIYISSREKWTVALGLRALTTQFYADWTALMAVSTVSLLPIMLIFAFAQKYFIQGVVFTGIKG